MRAIQRLVRNGNSTQITIPRPLLMQLGWLAGGSVLVELADNESLTIRKPRESDFGPRVKRPQIFADRVEGER